MVLSACDYLGEQSETCFPRGNDIELFSSELKKEGIKYEESTKKGCVIVYGLSDDKFKEIREKIFGVAPPDGLFVQWPLIFIGEVDGQRFEMDQSERIMQRFKEENINTKIMVFYGDEYLVWDEKDNTKAREIIYERK